MTAPFNVALFLFIAAIVLVLVIPGILLILIWKRMKTRRAKGTFAMVLLAMIGGLMSAAFFAGFIGNSPARIQRDHSVFPPRSATRIQCEGLVSFTTFFDDSALVSFQMARQDLAAFRAQFRAFKPSMADSNLLPSESGSFPHSGSPQTIYEGQSKDGNFQQLEIWPVDANSVGICLLTQWN